MASLMTKCSEQPAGKKKRAATKRRVLNVQENIPLANIYSVSCISKTFKPPSDDSQWCSDDEENVEQFQAKLDSRIKRKKPQNRKTNEYIIFSDDDESDVLTLSPKKSQELKRQLSSPSPPPPPEFYDERRESKTDSMIRQLDTAFFTFKNAQYLHKLSAAQSPSNVSESVSLSDADLDSSFDLSRNKREEINVKVSTKHGLKRFEIGMHEPFSKIMIDLANQENVEISRISLTRGTDDLCQSDTPYSKELLVTDILDCVVINPTSYEDYSHLVSDEDKVEVKFQGLEKRSVLTLKILKDDCFLTSFQHYSNFISIPEDKLKFVFDGDDVLPTDTPESLDMEGQGTIDVTLL